MIQEGAGKLASVPSGGGGGARPAAAAAGGAAAAEEEAPAEEEKKEEPAEESDEDVSSNLTSFANVLDGFRFVRLEPLGPVSRYIGYSIGVFFIPLRPAHFHQSLYPKPTI